MTTQSSPHAGGATPAGLEDELARRFLAVTAADLGAAGMREAGRLLLDYVACVAAALQSEPYRNLARRLRGGPGPASVIGCPDTLSAEDAVLLNGVAGHWYEWDDVYDAGALHVGAAILPVLLAAAESLAPRPVGGQDFLVVLGASAETACRLGKALFPAMPVGWMPTGIACQIAAAAGAARLGGGDAATIASAMGLAAASAGLGRQALIDNVNGKSALCAQAAGSALMAARLALAGLEGARAFLTGRFGVASLFGTDAPGATADFSGLLENLGGGSSLAAIEPKKYPSCRATHSAINASLMVREDYLAGLLRQDPALRGIEQVRIQVPAQFHALCGASWAPAKDPRVAAQFSIPYTVAHALLYGRIDVATFSEVRATQDEALLALAHKVAVEPLAADDAVPAGTSVRLQASLGNGHQINAIHTVAHDRLANACTAADKLGSLAGTAMSRARADELARLVGDLGQAPLESLAAWIRRYEPL